MRGTPIAGRRQGGGYRRSSTPAGPSWQWRAGSEHAAQRPGSGAVLGGQSGTMDDIELMLRVKSGDWLSFAALMDRHRCTVERFLFHKIRNRALAEELAQEAFLRVYRARLTYEPTARFKSWLFQIATNLASNSRRDNRREVLHQSLDTDRDDGPSLELIDARPTIEQRLVADAALEEVRRA